MKITEALSYIYDKISSYSYKRAILNVQNNELNIQNYETLDICHYDVINLTSNSQRMIYYVYLYAHLRANYASRKHVNLDNSKWFPQNNKRSTNEYHKWKPGEIGYMCFPDLEKIQCFLPDDFYCPRGENWFICVEPTWNTNCRVGPKKNKEITIIVFSGDANKTFVSTSLEYLTTFVKTSTKKHISNYIKNKTTKTIADFAVDSLLKRLKLHIATFSCGFINHENSVIKKELIKNQQRMIIEKKRYYSSLYPRIKLSLSEPITKKNNITGSVGSRLTGSIVQPFLIGDNNPLYYYPQFKSFADEIYSDIMVMAKNIQLQEKILQESRQRTKKKLRKKKEKNQRQRSKKKNFKLNKRNFPKVSRKSFRRQYQPRR
jgi:hypothetical protein